MKTSGLDVHKETIFCAIYGDDSPKKKSKHEVKEFQSLTCEIKQMKKLSSEYYQKDIELLKTIPGVSDISSMVILAETGGDMSAFEKSSKISGWAGLRPRNDESAGKYKSRSITKGNQYLRTILVQISWASIRIKGSYFKEKYQKLIVRKPYNKALIAIARKMLVVIWNILKDKKAFNPELLPVYDPVRLESKLKYHKKEFEKVQALLDK